MSVIIFIYLTVATVIFFLRVIVEDIARKRINYIQNLAVGVLWPLFVWSWFVDFVVVFSRECANIVKNVIKGSEK